MSIDNFVYVFQSNYAEVVTKNFKSFLDNDLYIDLIFVCRNNKKVGAHQVVFGCLSKFFYSIFLDNMNTAKEKVLHVYVPDIRAKIMKYILEFIYCGKAMLNKEELAEFNEDIKLLGMPLDHFSNNDPLNDTKPSSLDDTVKGLRKSKKSSSTSTCQDTVDLTDFSSENQSAVDSTSVKVPGVNIHENANLQVPNVAIPLSSTPNVTVPLTSAPNMVMPFTSTPNMVMPFTSTSNVAMSFTSTSNVAMPFTSTPNVQMPLTSTSSFTEEKINSKLVTIPIDPGVNTSGTPFLPVISNVVGLVTDAVNQFNSKPDQNVDIPLFVQERLHPAAEVPMNSSAVVDQMRMKNEDLKKDVKPRNRKRKKPSVEDSYLELNEHISTEPCINLDGSDEDNDVIMIS